MRLFLLALLVTPLVAAEPTSSEQFDRRVAPLLVRRCLDCHNSADKKGGLDLSRKETALAGGDSGAALVPGNPEESLLWERIDADEMPPKKPLPPAERALLKQWLADGAAWGTDPIDPFQFTTDFRAGGDWWSLQPVRRPEPPAVQQAGWVRNPIDAFILAKLEARGLTPSPEADRATLVRRLSFDLRGLPPTPAEITAFIDDADPRAYDNLVDRLLDSSAYGERWARHWLDIIRFGESQGFERDKLRTTSWRYRDWAVWALNQDLPYDEFVQLQLAGDVLQPDDPRAVVAAGFLVAGPYDEVGQTQQSAAMRAVVRQDEMEDIVGVTSQTFLGLTVNCARCHDHKFDPIRQTEYYRLSAALAGVRHGERESLTAAGKATLADRLANLDRQVATLAAERERIDGPVRARLLAERKAAPPRVKAPEPLARWEFDGDLKDALGTLHGTAHGAARIEKGKLVLDGTDGFVTTAPLPRDLAEKTLEAWVELGSLTQRGGGAIGVQTLDGGGFDSIVFGEREEGRWVAGSNFFERTQDVGGPAETADPQTPVHVAITYAADGTITIYRNGAKYGQTYRSAGVKKFEKDKTQVVFGLRHSPAGGNKHLRGSLVRAQLYDRALTADEVAASAGTPSPSVSEDELVAALAPNQRDARRRILHDLSQVELERRLLAGGPTYTNVPREPEPVHRLDRGNPAAPKELVTPGGVAAVSGTNGEFGLAADAPERERRVQLAKWITNPDNPLTPRVISNRLWQYHFGVGFVDTPNDFGFNGGVPTHPELLDWLAAELVARGWSLKHLHRLMVTSATYRQASRTRPEPAAIDADNRLWWRMTPRRLEAEAVRDAVLSAAGELNPALGGPGYQDFTTFTRNTQFYVPTDAVGSEFNRRSLYRTWVRSGRNPLLDVLDCPDPSAAAPRRAVTTTPLQALALLNNSFLLRMSDSLAARVAREAGDDIPAQLRRLYLLAYGRPPTADEEAALVPFTQRHGLPRTVRVVLNANEFVYVD